MATDGPALMAVVVVHGRAWDAAASMPLLRRWLDGDFAAGGAPALAHVLVWDNSPRPQGPAAPGGGPIAIVHDPTNGGTRAAYTAAAPRATEVGAEWVLLLDQDTTLPESFPAAVGAALRTPAAQAAAALLPTVRHGEAAISPAVVAPSGRVVPCALGAGAGVPTAIASGTVLRAADLAAVLPAPPEFWLDYLDHWLFLRLHALGRPVAPVECRIDHHLSVNDPASMSEWRYRNLLRAERRFVEELPLRARLGHRLRLGVRALRLARRAPVLARLALRAAFGGRA